MQDLYTILDKNNITYTYFDHPAIATAEAAEKLCLTIPGTTIKNLFVMDKKSGMLFLVVVPSAKRVNLKELKFVLKSAGIRFASEESLKQYLGVEPGSVTVLGLMHDITHQVNVIFDATLENKSLQCHPLVNTATLVINWNDINKFLQITGHPYQIIDIPSLD